ncbi:MAG: hypothetical protein J6Q99_03030 [Oscillospiraceae bacterium]|nr:hypothetical protein [Oscillospiraceae bacterium]
MQRKMSASSVAGIAAVVAMGATAAYVMGGHSSNARRKAIKRSTAKAARAVGTMVSDVVDNVSEMMK